MSKRLCIAGVCVFFCFAVWTFPLSGDTFTFSGDSMSTVIAEGKERTILRGNASIRSGSTHIEAETIELYGEDSRFAFRSGDVRVTDPEKGIILTTEELFYDRDEDKSRVDGYAEMEDQKNELIVKGGFLEHFGDLEITIIQIGVRILKEDLACRSEFARYRREDEILELSGVPYVYWKGDEYRASRIVINLDTDEILLEGEVEGTVVTEEEAEDPEEQAERSGDAEEQPEEAAEGTGNGEGGGNSGGGNGNEGPAAE